MAQRFFVTVIASSQRALLGLRDFDLDLFQPTARAGEAGEALIDGLVTLHDVGRLVEAGYQVTVRHDAAKAARAQQHTISFEQWRQGLQGEG